MSLFTTVTCSDKCWMRATCTVCGDEKAPVGRDIAAMANGGYCTAGDCLGYYGVPYPPHFWSKREYEEVVLGVNHEDC